jgi:RNA polymerase sigma factor (sigma-70 family)
MAIARPVPPLPRVSDSLATDQFLDRLDTHRRIVYKVASVYARDVADREDLAQEIIAQLWRAFPQWDAARPFSTWMYRVALNTAITWWRTESRHARRMQPATAHIFEVAAPDAEETDERLAWLHRAIIALPETDRALVLLYLDGHRHNVIAQIMGISESNVSTRLHRLTQRLRATV